jgi:chromatin remodeling complex protein RSC6
VGIYQKARPAGPEEPEKHNCRCQLKGNQDPKNRRNIIADANLKAIFGGKKKVTMFEMPKYVSQNLSSMQG